MRVGYPCINLSLPCRSSRTFRLGSYSEKRMRETVRGNLECLMETLKFNARHRIGFFRITSDLVPFASHPVCVFPWRSEFDKQLARIGDFIREHDLRVSMHPDQFVVLNSPDEGVYERSIAELEYHADLLDMLHVDLSAKIQIHAGGVYGDMQGSIERLVVRYRKLTGKIKRRLVVENDERVYDLSDCLRISSETGMPVVFDLLHFYCNNKGERLREALEGTFRTWKDMDGLPIVDYSLQEKGRRRGSHATHIDLKEFSEFLDETSGLDFDIMLEVKDKEKSALQANDLIRISHSDRIKGGISVPGS